MSFVFVGAPPVRRWRARCRCPTPRRPSRRCWWSGRTRRDSAPLLPRIPCPRRRARPCKGGNSGLMAKVGFTDIIFALNDFLCGFGHPFKVFFLLLQSSERLHQCLISLAHVHHSESKVKSYHALHKRNVLQDGFHAAKDYLSAEFCKRFSEIPHAAKRDNVMKCRFDWRTRAKR